MNEGSPKSIERERRQALGVIISALSLGAFVTGSPSFVPFALNTYWWTLLFYFGAMISSAYFLFRFMVRPRIVKKDFLMVLIYDPGFREFLYTWPIDYDLCSHYVPPLYRQFENAESQRRNDATLPLKKDELRQLSQAVLLCWLHNFGKPTASFISERALSEFFDPHNPSKLVKHEPDSYSKLTLANVSLNFSKYENPFLKHLPTSCKLPEGTKLSLTHSGLSLKSKYVTISIDAFPLKKTPFPSQYTRPILELWKKHWEPEEALRKERRALSRFWEVEFRVEFSAVIGWRALDVHLQWVNEMLGDLEKCLNWDRYIDALKEGSVRAQF